MPSLECAFEKTMTASEYVPEAASAQEIEVSLPEVEAYREKSHHLSSLLSANDNEAPPSLYQTVGTPRKSRFRYAVLPCAVFIIIVAIIVGTVEGVKGREHAGSSDTGPPLPGSPPPSNATGVDSQPMPLNTSIASTFCQSGDHWVFWQDEQNSIRAARQTPPFQWTVFPRDNIPATARSGSPLSASCTMVTDSFVLYWASNTSFQEGKLISIIYFDEGNLLGQSYFNGGSWRSVSSKQSGNDVIPLLAPNINASSLPPAIPASPASRLTISTNIIAAIESFNTSSSPQNDSLVSPGDVISSVATFQANDTAVMVDLVGTTYRTGNTGYYIENLLDQFKFFDASKHSDTPESACGLQNTLSTASPGRYACTYNVYGDGEISFRTCGDDITSSNGTLDLVCFSPDKGAVAAYEPYMLGQNESQIYGIYQSVSYILPPSGYENHQGVAPPSADTDISIVPLPGYDSANVYLTPAGNIAIVSNWVNAENSAWQQPIPFPHMSACADGNSPIVYTYFQVNATTMAEVVCSLEDGSWTPTYFDVDVVTE